MTVARPLAAGPAPVASPSASDWMACGDGSETFLTLPAHIAGAEARAMLDSGASRTVIDTAFAGRLGLRSTQGRKVAGLTGETGAGLTGPLGISLSITTSFTASALVMDLAPIAGAAGARIDLLLGHDLFLRKAIDIDPDRGALRFLDDAGERMTRGLPVVRTPDGHFCITAELTRGLHAPAVIDLGSLTPLYISPDFAARHDLFGRGRRGSSASVGVEGVVVSELGRLPRLRLGDAVLRDIPFSVPPAWAFAAPVVLGLPLLMRFRCLIDFARARMQMTAAHAFDRPFPRDRSGLGVAHRGDRLEVIHVAADSPAARAGLNAGDSIVAINHEAIGTRGARNQRNLGKRPAGTRYIVSVRAKGDREVILEEYY